MRNPLASTERGRYAAAKVALPPASSLLKSRLRTALCTVSFCIAVASGSPAQTFTSIASFDGDNGANPRYVSLVRGTDGSFYGTSVLGGPFFSYGTIFRITPAGILTNLYSFCPDPFDNCPDGAQPYAGLLLSNSGTLYGTTYMGGSGNQADCGGGGCGTVFSVTPFGIETPLYSFCSSSGCPDGAEPEAALVQDDSGTLYGTTNIGGSVDLGVPQGGTVFEITPTGALTTLYSFCSQNFFNGHSWEYCLDGKNPIGALVKGPDGFFYGTTFSGGANQTDCGGSGNCGTIFKISPTGTLTTIYSFCAQTGCADGQWPTGALVQGTDGNLYGTTEGGGANGNYGTIFRITPTGTLTTLYSFCAQSGCADGLAPISGLIKGNDEENFYGTTSGGRNGNYGTIFEITPDGRFTTLYSFCPNPQGGCPDGAFPYGALAQPGIGLFYGTTYGGGANGFGTVFSLSLAIPDNTLTVFIPSGGGAVTSTDGFINCPGACGHSYPPNTHVTLNATANQGGTFGGWGGTCSGTGPCQLTITQDLFVTASFGQPPAITSANNTLFSVNAPASFTVTTTGSPSPSITEAGPLPAGIFFFDNRNGTGILGGTPTVNGIFNITFTAQNGNGPPATQLFTLVSALNTPSSGNNCNGVYQGTFNGSLTVTNGQNCTFVSGGVTGNITLQQGGMLLLSHSTIGSNVQLNNGGTLSLQSVTIGGNLQVQNLPASATMNQVCNSTVRGGMQWNNNAAPVNIGAYPAGACGGNIVGGNLQVQNNRAALQVGFNAITNALQCGGNTSITGGGNTARQKQGQCVSF